MLFAGGRLTADYRVAHTRICLARQPLRALRSWLSSGLPRPFYPDFLRSGSDLLHQVDFLVGTSTFVSTPIWPSQPFSPALRAWSTAQRSRREGGGTWGPLGVPRGPSLAAARANFSFHYALRPTWPPEDPDYRLRPEAAFCTYIQARTRYGALQHHGRLTVGLG